MRNFLLDDDYELRADSELDEIMEELPTSLLMENIREQIDEPLVSSVDNLSQFIKKCNELHQNNIEDIEISAPILNHLTETLNNVLFLIQNKFNIGVDVREESIGEQIDIVNALYKVLVLKYRKNLTKFFYKYIMENKDMLIAEYSNNDYLKSKDVTSATMRSYNISDESLLAILCNLPLIIKDICANNSSIEPDEFLRYCGLDKSETGDIVLSWFGNGRICGTFVGEYLEGLLDQYEDVRNEILSDIKFKLIKKFSKL